MKNPEHQALSECVELSQNMRAPLAVVSGCLQILEEELAGQFSDLTTPALSKARELARMVDRMLESHELDAGLIQPEGTSFDVLELVTAVIDDHLVLAREKNLRTHISMSIQDAHAWTDARRIQRALGEVMEHIIGGTDSGHVSIRVESVDNQCSVTVSGGLIPEQLDNDFFVARASLELIGGQLSVRSDAMGSRSIELFWPLALSAPSHLRLAA